MKARTRARRFFLRSAGCLALLLCLPVYLALAAQDISRAQVTEVIDGDTVKVLLESGERATVRYLGIDTPELHHPSRGEEEFGKEARAANAALVMGREVLLERDVQIVDRYGRMLAWVWVREGNARFLVNAELARLGYAMPFTLAPNVRYTNLIIEAFREARLEERGFWKPAAKRVFSASQAWAELPALVGHFITLELVVEEIRESRIRYSLISAKGLARFVVYKGDAPRFTDLELLEGRRVKAVGKLVAGYQGAEMTLADPVQILGIQ